MMESENCMSSPITALKDCSVFGRAVCSGKPNEKRSHSAPSRRTPNFVRGVKTRRRFESISSKSLTRLPPRSTSPSPTYVPSATYSPESGQKPLVVSSANAVAARRNAAQMNASKERKARIFTRLATAVPAKEGDSFGNVFHHHGLGAQSLHAVQGAKRCG